MEWKHRLFGKEFVKVKLATVVEGDQKGPTTPR